MEKNSLNNFLNFAREKEEEAAHFYITCADLTDRVQMKNVFLEMAEEDDVDVHAVLLRQETDYGLRDLVYVGGDNIDVTR